MVILSMKKKRNYRKQNDFIDKAIDKISMKKWGNSYQTNWKSTYEQGDYQTLRNAIRQEVKDYMEVQNLTADEAVKAIRRSRYYTSQADFYRNSIYEELKDLGYNRNMVDLENYNPVRRKGTFVNFQREAIQYHGNVDIDGTIYQKYSFESNGKQLYYYKSRSPKDENYKPWITGENYE